MPEIEGSMHSHAANPEPEEVFVINCKLCEEPIYVGNSVAKDDGGMMHEDCWRGLCDKLCQEQIFTVDVTHIEDNPHE